MIHQDMHMVELPISALPDVEHCPAVRDNIAITVSAVRLLSVHTRMPAYACTLHSIAIHKVAADKLMTLTKLECSHLLY